MNLIALFNNSLVVVFAILSVVWESLIYLAVSLTWLGLLLMFLPTLLLVIDIYKTLGVIETESKLIKQLRKLPEEEQSRKEKAPEANDSL